MSFFLQNALHNRDRLLADSYNNIERRLKLVGTTGIEDKLQDGVPGTAGMIESTLIQ